MFDASGKLEFSMSWSIRIMSRRMRVEMLCSTAG